MVRVVMVQILNKIWKFYLILKAGSLAAMSLKVI
jgi:hypothetical protein